MADTKISALPAASALDGTELAVVVQGGANKKATGTQIKTLAQSGLGTAAFVATTAFDAAGAAAAAQAAAELASDPAGSASAVAGVSCSKAVYDPQAAGKISGATFGTVGGVLNLDGGAGGSCAGGSINLAGGSGTGAAGGSVNAPGSGSGTGAGGSFSAPGVGNNAGGSVNLSAAAGGPGGSIVSTGNGNGTSAFSSGGSLTMSGGSGDAANGGSIDTSGGSVPGGSLTTASGGGSIDTTGTGLIELGVAATRTSIVGAATAPRTLTLPDANATILSPDTGWTANADAGDKTAVIPTDTAITMDLATLEVAFPGITAVIIAMADKIKALEAALAANLTPNI